MNCFQDYRQLSFLILVFLLVIYLKTNTILDYGSPSHFLVRFLFEYLQCMWCYASNWLVCPFRWEFCRNHRNKRIYLGHKGYRFLSFHHFPSPLDSTLPSLNVCTIFRSHAFLKGEKILNEDMFTVIVSELLEGGIDFLVEWLSLDNSELILLKSTFDKKVFINLLITTISLTHLNNIKSFKIKYHFIRINYHSFILVNYLNTVYLNTFINNEQQSSEKDMRPKWNE